MSDAALAPDDSVRRRMDGEARMVREAILMVASHGSPRLTVAGLAFGREILDRSRRAALEAGVRVRPLRDAAGDRIDIVVEAVI